ncbi:MAG TPA: hypothetical protein VKA27_15855 [Sunxiuqinia sp.]|nr:hypothetical protein [Sunxiuqinia sp.]
MTKETKPNKKAKMVGSIVGAIAFGISYYGVQQLFFKPNVEKELKTAATKVNEKCPIQVDQYSRLDSASSTGKTNFTYYYTLFDLTKAEVNLDTVNKYIRPNIIENVKSSPQLKIYRDNKITMDYKYYDKNGLFVTIISVTPNLYSE